MKNPNEKKYAEDIARLDQSLTPVSGDGSKTEYLKITKARCPECGVTKKNAYLALLFETARAEHLRCQNCDRDFSKPKGWHKQFE
jgi:hypothetical protein